LSRYLRIFRSQLEGLGKNYRLLTVAAVSSLLFMLVLRQMDGNPPSLFYVIYRTISLAVGDGLTALKLSGALAFAAMLLSTFMFAKGVTESSIAGLGASLMVSFSAAQFEMLWQGAYPSLLGLAFTSLALLMFLRAQRKDDKLTFAAVILGGLVLASRQLAFLVYLVTLVAMSLIVVAFREKASLPVNLSVVGALLLLSVLYRFLVGFGCMLQDSALGTQVGYSSLDAAFGLFKSMYLLFLIGVLAVVGSVQLFLAKRSLELSTVLVWLSSSLLLPHFLGLPADVQGLLYLSIVPLCTLCTIPLLCVRGSVVVSKDVGNDPVYEVEIRVGPAGLAALTLVALLVTPVVGLAGGGSAYANYAWTSTHDDQEEMRVLDWIKGNAAENATIVSDFDLGRWVECYAQRKALFTIPSEAIPTGAEFERSLAADAIVNSCYQLANTHMKLDDTQPMSDRFSPRISVFKGIGYTPLLYIDSSFVRANFTRDERTWIEAPYKAWYYQSQWLERSGEKAVLQHSFETLGLLFAEKLSLEADKPVTSIRFAILAKENVSLNSASMAIWLDWDRWLLDSEINGSRVRIVTDIGKMELSFVGYVAKIEIGRDEEFNQNRILVGFHSPPDRCEVGVDIRVLNADFSWIGPVWSASSTELEQKYGVELIAVPKCSVDAERLRARPPQGQVLYVDDAFVRVVFEKAGHEWIEAPYRAKVLWEENRSLQGGSSRITAFETGGLYINKTTIQMGSNFTITYDVEAKEGVSLERLLLPVWLVWGRTVSDARVENSRVTLVTDSGTLRLTPSKEGLKICNTTDGCYGLDEEYHQPRMLIQYSLGSHRGTASLTFEALNEGSKVSTRVDLTSRPIMNGSDRTWIASQNNAYTEVFTGNELSLFEVPKLDNP